MAIHPFFDPDSRYRQATTETIWADGGRDSVRRFFIDRAREVLYEEWQTEIPASVQSWGYSPEADQILHNALLERARKSARQVPQRERETAVFAATGGEPPPALVHLDLTKEPPWHPQVTRFPDVPASVFTGISLADKEPSDHFSLELRGLGARRQIAVLLMAYPQLQGLADACGLDEPLDEPAALALITDALSVERLTDTQRQPGELSQCSRLSGALRLVPTLGAASDESGSLSLRVELGRRCPLLRHWSWVVVCQGPELDSFA